MDSLVVSIPAACGEIVEGRHLGTAYLASYCIDLYQTCIIVADGQARGPHRVKSRALLALLEDTYDIELGNLSIRLEGDIPLGKGLASSSADLAATLFAVNEWFHLGLLDTEIYQIMCQIEPSDGNLFEGLSLVDFQKGKLLDTWEWYLDRSLHVAVVISQESVDSQAFYQRKNFSDQGDCQVDPLFEAFKQGMAGENLASLAQVALESGNRNQARLFNPYWDSLKSLREIPGIVLINLAHSGSLVALIYQTRLIADSQVMALIRQTLAHESDYQLSIHQIVPPGPRIERRSYRV